MRRYRTDVMGAVGSYRSKKVQVQPTKRREKVRLNILQSLEIVGQFLECFFINWILIRNDVGKWGCSHPSFYSGYWF